MRCERVRIARARCYRTANTWVEGSNTASSTLDAVCQHHPGIGAQVDLVLCVVVVVVDGGWVDGTPRPVTRGLHMWRARVLVALVFFWCWERQVRSRLRSRTAVRPGHAQPSSEATLTVVTNGRKHNDQMFVQHVAASTPDPVGKSIRLSH